MKHLIMVCNLEDIQFENLNKSSSRYELNFALEMSELVEKISIVSSKIKTGNVFSNIHTYHVKDGNLLYQPAPFLKEINKIIKIEEETVLLFWGYNPLLIRTFCKLKSQKMKVVSMIYDTHLGEMNQKNVLRRQLINLFYFWGIKQISKLDGILLFKEQAKSHLAYDGKTCILLPTVNLKNVIDYSVTDNNETIFLYSGTLCSYNGISELVQAFMELPYEKITLKIFGDGALSTEVIQAAKIDKRIVYYGRVKNSLLKKEIETADVMLNLRQVPSIVNDFAFPSKIIEYMSLGKVVLSTKISEAKEFKNAVVLLDDLNKNTIFSKLSYLCENKKDLEKIFNNAKIYLEKYHDYKEVSLKAYRFMFEEIFDSE